MKRLLLPIVLMTFSPAIAQEATAGFKGIPFGTGCATFFQQYKPGGTWADSKLAANIFFSGPDQALVATPPASYGIMMGKTYQDQKKDSVAGVEADTRFIFAVQSPADAAKLKAGVDRRTADRALFQEVQARFDPQFADQVLAALIEKYGQPTRTDSRTLTKKFTGVQAQVPIQVWEIKGAVIEFTKISPPKGDPLLTMRSTTVKSLAAKAGASDL